MGRSTLEGISEKGIDDTLRFIAQRGWKGKAESFLPALAQHLGETLSMKYAIISQLTDDPNLAEIVTLYGQEELAPNTRYLLENTPCENVMGKKLCCYPQGMQALFPADDLLTDMGVESYVGIPLSDSTGQAMGLIAVMDDKPIVDEKTVVRLLQLVETAAASALERARSDRALRASERKFRSLAENSPDHIARYAPDGSILYINPVIEKTLGIRLKDLQSEIPHQQIANGAFQETAERVSEAARSGVASDWDVHFQAVDGSWRWHAIHFVPERDETGNVVSVLGIGRDITERKKLEAELSASRSFLNRIIDSVADPIFVKDRQHRWIYVNQALCGLIGHSREELIGKSDFDYFPKQQARVFWEGDEVVFNSGKEFSNEEEITDDRGEKRCIYTRKTSFTDAQGEAILVGVISDITQRKRSESLLAQYASEFHTLAENLPDLLVRYDLEARFVYVNPGFQALLGFSLEELRGKTPAQITGLPDAAFFEQVVRDAIQSGEEFEFEHKLLLPDGSSIWGLVHVAPEFDEAGRVAYVLLLTRDISERKSAEEKLRLAATVFANSYGGVMITDSEHVIIDVNPAFTRITGYTRDEVVGKRPNILSSGRQSQAFFDELWETLQKQDNWHGEIWNRRKNGEAYAVMLSISAVRDDEGQLQHYISVFSDISPLKEHEKELDRIAHYDALTGVPNRRLLNDRLDRAIARTRRDPFQLAVCYLDLDGFKPINDRYGHETGDRLLIEITHRLQAAIRPDDTIARMGGDEFVLLLLKLSSLEECRLVLDRLLRIVSEPVIIDKVTIAVSVSIGMTLYPPDDSNADVLLRHADHAMYCAKRMGKNRFHIYDPKDDQSVLDDSE
ncbi:MAG: PAS domain S-box protein [Candidatus Thiodiazotropha sp.]|jgi:diguanylate cyclase (GGDEF)-like protein/PAS domain S-box-containing protein